jgi:thioredoxin reductase
MANYTRNNDIHVTHRQNNIWWSKLAERQSVSFSNNNNNNNNNNNLIAIQFFIIYVPSQQTQGQLQTQHTVDTSNYIMDKHNIKSKTNYEYRQALEETHINAEK